MATTLRVTYRKSAIGYSRRQKDTIASLGLKRLGQTVELPDNPAIRGMVQHVRHLVVVEDGTSAAAEPGGGVASGSTGAAPVPAARATGGRARED